MPLSPRISTAEGLAATLRAMSIIFRTAALEPLILSKTAGIADRSGLDASLGRHPVGRMARGRRARARPDPGADPGGSDSPLLFGDLLDLVAQILVQDSRASAGCRPSGARAWRPSSAPPGRPSLHPRKACRSAWGRAPEARRVGRRPPSAVAASPPSAIMASVAGSDAPLTATRGKAGPRASVAAGSTSGLSGGKARSSGVGPWLATNWSGRPGASPR